MECFKSVEDWGDLRSMEWNVLGDVKGERFKSRGIERLNSRGRAALQGRVPVHS